MAEKQPNLWEIVGMWSLIVGAAAVVVLLFWVPRTWREAAAVFVAAVVYFAGVMAVGLALRYPWSDILRAWWWRLPIGMVAGVAAGITWWLIAAQSEAWILAALTGAGLGGLAAVFEAP